MLPSRLILGIILCVACLALAGLLHVHIRADPAHLLQSKLFLGDEEHLMREMADSWRDRESLRLDEGEAAFPEEDLRSTRKRQILAQKLKPAKFSMLASPSKSQLTKTEMHASTKISSGSQQSKLNAKSAVLKTKTKNLHKASHAASSSDKSEHVEANSLVKFAANLAQEIVRR
jgi:hypothetical protein